MNSKDCPNNHEAMWEECRDKRVSGECECGLIFPILVDDEFVNVEDLKSGISGFMWDSASMSWIYEPPDSPRIEKDIFELIKKMQEEIDSAFYSTPVKDEPIKKEKPSIIGLLTDKS